MRILSLKDQNEIMQRAIDIVIELRKNLPDDSAIDAMDDALEIVLKVGGKEMVEHMTGTAIKKRHRSVMREVTGGLSKCIEVFDEVVDGFERG